LQKGTDGKLHKFNNFYRNERYIFHCHKANLKNFLNEKIEQISDNTKKIKKMVLSDTKKKNNINKQMGVEKNEECKIEELEVNNSLCDSSVIHSNGFTDVFSENDLNDKSSSDSSFKIKCKKNKRNLINKENLKDSKLKCHSVNERIELQNNLKNGSFQDESIINIETTDLTPKKLNIFDSIFESEIKYQVFEEKQNGYYSDNFKNVFVSENESILSDDEKYKNKFHKFNVDLKILTNQSEEYNINDLPKNDTEMSTFKDNFTNISHNENNQNKSILTLKKDLDYIESLCKEIKSEKKFLVVKNESLKANKNLENQSRINKNKKFQEDIYKNIISKNSDCENSLFKDEIGNNISSICNNQKEYKVENNDEHSILKPINQYFPEKKEKKKLNIPDYQKSFENRLLIKNFNFDLKSLSRFDLLKNESLNFKKLEFKKKSLSSIPYDINLKEQIKKKQKVNQTKYPEFEDQIRKVYFEKKQKRKEYLKKYIDINKKSNLKKKFIKKTQKHYDYLISKNDLIKKEKEEYSFPLLNIISKKRPRIIYCERDEESEMHLDEVQKNNINKIIDFKDTKNESKKHNQILLDTISESPSDYDSYNLTNLVNNHKSKKITTNSISKIKSNLNNDSFYDSINNNINLRNLRNYVTSRTNQKNLPNHVNQTNNDKLKNDKSSNFFNIKQFKHNANNYGNSDNSSVLSSDKSISSTNIKGKMPINNLKSNLLKKNSLMKNHNIHEFFHSTNLYKEKEEEFLKNILVLFNNDKYSKLLNLQENHREILSETSSSIFLYCQKLISEFNIINEDMVNFEKNKINEVIMDSSEFIFYLDQYNKLDFELDLELSLKKLLSFYKDKMIDFINIFFLDNEDQDFKEKENIKFLEEEKMKICIDKLIMSENIIKSFIKISDMIISINLERNNEKLNIINFLLQTIKELFFFFIKKIFLDLDMYKFNTFNSRNSSIEYSYFEIFSDFLINRLGIFINIIENLIYIQYQIIDKLKQKIQGSINNINIKFFEELLKKLLNELASFKFQFNQFLMILSYFILIKIYGLDFSEINFKNFDKNKLSQNFEYLSLLKIICETLLRLDRGRNFEITDIDLIQTIFQTIRKIFNDYLIIGLNHDHNPNFEFEEALINNQKKHINRQKVGKEENQNQSSKEFLKNMKLNFNNLIKNIIYENVVNKDILYKNMKVALYKIFIIMTNQIIDTNILSYDLKKFIHNEPILDIYRRYFNHFILIFFDINLKYSQLTYMEELLDKNIHHPDYHNKIEKLNTFNIFSYYDLENIIRNLNNPELKNKINYNKPSNLLNEYLISDLKSLILIEKYWKIEPINIIKFIFKLFNILNSKHRRFKESTCLKQNKNIYKIIDTLFQNAESETHIDDYKKEEEESKTNFLIEYNENQHENDIDFFQSSTLFKNHLEFIFRITRLIRKMLSVYPEEKNKKIILSKFVSQVSDFLNKDKVYNDNILESNVGKLNTISFLCIAFSYIEFSNCFKNNENIELCVKKFKEILDFSTSSVFIKGINIAISIKIILNYSRKNINLTEPIKNLNNQLNYIYEQILLHDVRQPINNSNIDNKNKISVNNTLENVKNYEDAEFLKNEIFPTLHFLLINLHKISNEKTFIFIENPKILEDIKNMLQPKLNIAINYKQIMINILINCIEKSEEIIKNKMNKNTIIEEDGMIIEIPFEFLEDEIVIQEYFSNHEFYISIKNNFLPILNSLIHSLILENKGNTGSLSQTISFPFLKSVTDLFTKICGIFSKYQIISINIFNEKFNIQSSFFSSALRKMLSYNSKISSNINIANGELLDGITQIPFRAFMNFLFINPSIIKNELLNMRNNNFLINILKLIFYGFFYNLYFQNHKLNHSIFSKIISKSEDKSYTIDNENIRENLNFIIEATKIFKLQRYFIEQKISESKRETILNGKNKQEDINLLNTILFFSEDRIFELIKKLPKNPKSLDDIFYIFFKEYLFISPSSDRNIELRFFINIIKDLEEIIYRGVSLEFIRKNKKILTINSDNYCFTITNFFFYIYNSINFPEILNCTKINDYRFLVEFINLCQITIGNFLNDFNFKDLSHGNLTIGYNIFQFCGEILFLNFEDRIKRMNLKDKILKEKLDCLFSSFSIYINYLVNRIKAFLDNYLNLFRDKIIKSDYLNFSKGFTNDYYFKKEKEEKLFKQINEKLILRIINNKFCLIKNNQDKEKNGSYKLVINENVDSERSKIFNLLNEESQIQNELNNMEQENQELMQIQYLEKSITDFEHFSKDISNQNKNIYHLDSKLIKNFLPIDNSFKIDKNNDDKNAVFTQNLDISLNTKLASSHKNDIDDYKFSFKENGLFKNEYSKKNVCFGMKKNYIRNLINIIKYISSKKFLYEYSFSSKSYYLLILFGFNKIIKNYIDDITFTENIQKLISCLNFRKYPILTYEDLFLNIRIIKLLELFLDFMIYERNLVEEKKIKSKFFFLNNQSSKKIFGLEYSHFTNKILEYLLEALNFIIKNSIAIIKFKKFSENSQQIIGNLNNVPADKNFYDNLFFPSCIKPFLTLNKSIEKTIKKHFNRECEYAFKNESDIILNPEFLNDEKNYITKEFLSKKKEMLIDLLTSMDKIKDLIYFLLKNNKIDLENNHNILKLNMIQILDLIEFSIKFLYKMLKFEKKEEKNFDNSKNYFDKFRKNEVSNFEKKYMSDFINNFD